MTRKKKEKAPNIRELKKALEQCQKTKQEYLAGWQRERADFLNYKKEEIQRFQRFLENANESLILEILPILDNFELSEKELPKDLKRDENIKGVLQIKKQFEDFLKNKGLEQIESLGQKFNPEFHEVVEEVQVSNKKSGIIVEEIKKGYKLNGRVIRPAKVKICQKY